MISYYAMNDGIKEENNCTNFSQGHIIGEISTNSKDYADYFSDGSISSGAYLMVKVR